jgi:cytochrome P450/NADPH-cytochrome P450 reductase
MRVAQTLTIKPKGFLMRATLRDGLTARDLQDRLYGTVTSATKHGAKEDILHPASGIDTTTARMTILYGSNTGTCQALAQKLSAQAAQHGLQAQVTDMDSLSGNIPKHRPVIIITASYEGQPPDNAASFFAWLQSVTDNACLKGTEYAVFGCGHSDWHDTFMRIPKLVDERIFELGGTRLADRGISDAAKKDMLGDFDTWLEEKLWPNLAKVSQDAKPEVARPSSAPPLKVIISTQERAQQLQQNCQWAEVIDAKTLTEPGQPEKRHIAIKLIPEVTYKTGDYLAILPLNTDESLRRILKRFSLPWDATITIDKTVPSIFPTNVPISLSDLLKGYVEISQPASRKVSLSPIVA